MKECIPVKRVRVRTDAQKRAEAKYRKKVARRRLERRLAKLARRAALKYQQQHEREERQATAVERLSERLPGEGRSAPVATPGTNDSVAQPALEQLRRRYRAGGHVTLEDTFAAAGLTP